MQAFSTMGGGKQQCNCDQIICQLCDKHGHTAAKCPIFTTIVQAAQSSSGAQSSNTTQSSSCCFNCEQSSHWANHCPWKTSNCPIGCGARKLLTSIRDWSKGQKFIKCMKCGNFEWLKDAMKNETRGSNINVKIKVNLYDLCNLYENKMKFL